MKIWNFFLFSALQRAQKVSLYTLPGFKSRQIPRGRSLQNIMTIAHELARKFGKNLPPPNMLVLESGSLFCSNLQFLYKNLLIFILLKFWYSENRKNPEIILKINFTSCKLYKSIMIFSCCLPWIIQTIQTCNNLILHQFTLKIIEIRRD